MTTPARRMSLEEVLDEFFYSADKPSATMVLNACQAHPEYREDIMEFASLWSAYAASPEPARIMDEVSEVSVNRLQSFVLNLLHEADRKADAKPSCDVVSAAIEGLAGGKLRRAAKAAELGESTLLLQKVLTKRIPNVPRFVLDRLAEHFNLTIEALGQALSPGLAGARSYKSSDKPNNQAEETWESAVRSLPVPEEEKKRLLSLQHRG
ncbi:hypothetical protein [Pseudomarimonas arenosa]|uniref:Uncharacterized protein n=1 Tax=Pseudomarimonas arenosa TaxID=2774145 RepID=A0AAW3ZDU9_9GAMM|nr:hypothetical protein [Pseudomarimonas arenosa]MBD8524358.1 hypothetical protein [Pseudomarimonas arenosa]